MVINNEFVPTRLREARIARGMTMQELAERLGVTRQSVSRYESISDILKPSPTVLSKISMQLDFPLPFFSKPIDIALNERKVYFFRSRKSSEAIRREQISLMGDWTQEVTRFIDKSVKLPPVNIPDIAGFEKDSYSADDIECITIHVRKTWGLGTGPIDNLLLVMEKNGFVISSSNINDDKAEACSTKLGGRPFIFLGNDVVSACRTRLSAAHELGHMILHSHIDETELLDPKKNSLIEREAFRFASAFLLPEESFSSEVVSSRLDHFINLKRRWKVSIGAMIYRCSDLGIFDESQILYLRKIMSVKKYIKNEPLDDEIPKETPILLKTAVKISIDGKRITPQDLYESFRWNYPDIENIIAYDRGTLAPDDKGIVLNFRMA